jgi:hypothetical protein
MQHGALQDRKKSTSFETLLFKTVNNQPKCISFIQTFLTKKYNETTKTFVFTADIFDTLIIYKTSARITLTFCSESQTRKSLVSAKMFMRNEGHALSKQGITNSTNNKIQKTIYEQLKRIFGQHEFKQNCKKDFKVSTK